MLSLSGNVCTLLLLLLLHDGGSAKFNLFRRNPAQREGAVRLSGTGSVSEGRVEVYHLGKWGTVCDDNWDIAEAQVVCRQLNFPAAKSVVIGKDYGEATGPIWLDDVKCKGTESSLSTCEFKNWGVTDCSHKEDVGVICDTGDANMTLGDSIHSLDHSISLSDKLGQMFDSGNACDFLISVQSPTGNILDDGTPEMLETTTCAHKLILSQYPLFNASEANTNITVTVRQSCQPLFTTFIRYIYTRKIDMTFSSVQCLHWLASRFGVKQLVEGAGQLFSKILPEDNLFHTQVSLYEYAVETGDLLLQDNCIQYLAWNFQNLTRSPAWQTLSAELLRALLSRSDLVVPDEYFLLQTVESWIAEKGNSSSLETHVDLLRGIRFPMIPAEQLYQLEFNSSLYSTHETLYRENMLNALQFNVLLFSNLPSNPKFNINSDDYQPRIYTAEPWSIYVDPAKKPPFIVHSYNKHGYGYVNSQSSQTITKSFSTPVHNSLIFKDKTIYWDVSVFTSKRECPVARCESVPLAKLSPRTFPKYKNVLFGNRLLLMCQGKHICQVYNFKETLAHVTVNGTYVAAYPCPDGQYTYRFVVRPEFV